MLLVIIVAFALILCDISCFKKNEANKEYEYLEPSNGSGSGQQVVSVTDDQTDSTNQYWSIKPEYNKQLDVIGQVVRCGDIISLKHSNTQVYLHSHLHPSPISNNQEVSGFEGHDTGDNFIVECNNNSNKELFWKREMPVYLKHKDTNKYMATNKQHKYSHPLSGHIEAFVTNTKDKNGLWIAQLDFFSEHHKTSEVNGHFGVLSRWLKGGESTKSMKDVKNLIFYLKKSHIKEAYHTIDTSSKLCPEPREPTYRKISLKDCKL